MRAPVPHAVRLIPILPPTALEHVAMGRVVVDVMPKPEILDPQGKAVAGALARLGFTEFSAVRQGKRFELEVDGEVTGDVLDRAREAAETVLSNPVIEDVVRVVDAVAVGESA
jgi:phosphoribosylformylglycinamidine synthase